MGVRWVKDHVFVPLYRAYQRWDRDGGGQMAAATGYYMALSFFPLLLVLLAVLGLLLRFTNWGRNAEEQLLTIIAEYSDPTLAEQVRNAISSVEINATVSGPIGLLTLLFAAMAIFAQLDRAFDRIWSLPEAPRRGVLATLRTILLDRLRAFLMLLVMGVLAVAAFVLNMTLSTLAAYAERYLPFTGSWWHVVTAALAVIVNWGVFTMLYKTLPKAPIRWSEAVQGGLVASAIWEIGRRLLAAFVIGSKYSVYGTVGAFIAIMLWVYYTAATVFFGAEFVRVIWQRREDARRPKDAL